MAGGGLVNLTTLGLGGAWNESDDKGIDTIATPRSVSYTHLTLPTTPYV